MSSVWKFFKKEDNNNDSASCNLCGKLYKTCGNTTNLATHLKNRHHFAYLQMMKMPSSLKTTKSSEETGDAAAVDLNNSNLSLPSTSTGYKNSQQSQEDVTVNPAEMLYHEAKKRKKSTLVACLERGSSFEEGGQKHSEITQALIYMICKDNLPLSCVEKKGLQKLMGTACPLYKLPSRKK
ncbi:unnamed protein product [Parnassius mnemosyne]|uniref:BED-type domain-containing protein n=1 Tax=Parnassius mnemosyne TaxID=213953 RepID=A0AAV1LW27_9NEOP